MKTSINALFSPNLGLDTFSLRIGAGAIFIPHGAQKLFAWFGGYGLESTPG
jgi:putative oxidoreductase